MKLGKTKDEQNAERWDELRNKVWDAAPGVAYELPKGWVPMKEKSDGSTASYYELPDNAIELQDLISDRNMNAQIGEIFRECYRYGRASHSDEMRGIKKILFYANAELKRLQK
jgi:hypothetical protein